MRAGEPVRQAKGAVTPSPPRAPFSQDSPRGRERGPARLRPRRRRRGHGQRGHRNLPRAPLRDPHPAKTHTGLEAALATARGSRGPQPVPC